VSRWSASPGEEEAVRVSVAGGGEALEGMKAQESSGPRRKPEIRTAGARTCARSKALKPDFDLGSKRQEGTVTPKRCWRLGAGSKALKGETPWALPAWNKAGRRLEKEGAKRLRKPEGATYRVRQARG
jgi:hypothetical protein